MRSRSSRRSSKAATPPRGMASPLGRTTAPFASPAFAIARAPGRISRRVQPALPSTVASPTEQATVIGSKAFIEDEVRPRGRVVQGILDAHSPQGVLDAHSPQGVLDAG